MLLLYLCCFFLSDRIAVADSSLIKVDPASLEALKVTLGDNIADYVIDDHIYALTSRYLFKIDLNTLRTLDRIPLPQHFNYVTCSSNEVILIAAAEIITVEKKNLSFLSGIGIEPGDYRPIIAPRLLAPAKRSNLVYLLSDDGKKSHFKVFDLTTGKLAMRLSTSMITSCRYDPATQTLMCSDISNQLTFRALDLKKKKQLKLDAACLDFKQSEYGYLIRNQQGIYAVDRRGKTIDFQPMYASRHADFHNFLFVMDNYLVFLDTLTLRTRSVLPNSNGIMEVMLLDDLTSIGINGAHELYLIDNNRMTIERLKSRDIPLERPPTTPAGPTLDSLWYIQLAAFSKPAYAAALWDSLHATGLPVFVDSSGLYRVMLGGFQDKITALEVLEALNVPGWTMFSRTRAFSGEMEFVAGGNKYVSNDGIIRKERQ